MVGLQILGRVELGCNGVVCSVVEFQSGSTREYYALTYMLVVLSNAVSIARAWTTGTVPSRLISLLATRSGRDWSFGVHALATRANGPWPH